MEEAPNSELPIEMPVVIIIHVHMASWHDLFTTDDVITSRTIDQIIHAGITCQPVARWVLEINSDLLNGASHVHVTKLASLQSLEVMTNAEEYKVQVK